MLKPEADAIHLTELKRRCCTIAFDLPGVLGILGQGSAANQFFVCCVEALDMNSRPGFNIGWVVGVHRQNASSHASCRFETDDVRGALLQVCNYSSSERLSTNINLAGLTKPAATVKFLRGFLPEE